jgi:glycerophosphoryl diester phosphodiesterase
MPKVVRRATLNIAHRGASGRFPENTITAFRAAIEAGAHMCELDVQATRDGAVVVIHDEVVDRVTDGHGEVAAMTLAELKRLDAAAKFKGTATSVERIPTLDEVFEATAGRCGLNVELKAGGLESKIAALMRRHHALSDSMISSFEWEWLRTIRGLDPEIRIGLLTDENPTVLMMNAVAMKACAINPHFKIVSVALCDAAHERGLKVFTWTVDAPDAMRELIDAGVDGIMTNFPERLREILGG